MIRDQALGPGIFSSYVFSTKYTSPRHMYRSELTIADEPPPLPPQPQPSSLSFTQGLLLGQLSVVLLIGAFIKFFIFGEAPPPPSRGFSSRAAGRGRSYSMHGMTSMDSTSSSQRDKPSTSNVLRPVPSSSTNTRSILRKTYYNTSPTNPSSKHGRQRLHHSSHQPESLDWFNVLIAQTISQYRQTAYMLKDCPHSSMLESLTATLNNPEKKPSFIDSITITDISLGEEFPIFSNCRVIAVDDPNSDGGRLQALMDVDLSDDNLSIAIQTSLLLNYPKPFSAVLPVALAVSVVRFSGTLCISFVPAATPPSHTPSPPPDSNRGQEGQTPHDRNEPDPNESTNDNDAKGTPKTNLAFSFLPDYRLDLSVRSLIGSRSRLQDLPKVAQLVEARVQAWFEERVVEPRVQVVGLPGMWPRMGRTGVRAQEDSEVGTRLTTANANASGSDAVPADRDREAELEGLRYRRGGGAGGGDGVDRDGAHRARGESFAMPGSMPDVVPAL